MFSNKLQGLLSSLQRKNIFKTVIQEKGGKSQLIKKKFRTIQEDGHTKHNWDLKTRIEESNSW